MEALHQLRALFAFLDTRSESRRASSVGLGKLHTHSMRHTFRSWLGAVGTPIGVQQKLMRHADIRGLLVVARLWRGNPS